MNIHGASTSGLPSWAKVLAPKDRDDVVTNTQQSERLLRIDANRLCHQRIQKAADLAWYKTVESMMDVNTRRRKVSKITSTTTSTSTSTSTASVDTAMPSHLETLKQRYTITIHNNEALARPLKASGTTDEHSVNDQDYYPWDLLPITIIHTFPSCPLDRNALTEALYQHYWNAGKAPQGDEKASSVSCCPVRIPRLQSSLHATLQLVLRQCLAAETDPSLRQALKSYVKRSKKKSLSLQQAILWWASQTTAFDSIVLLISDPGGFAQTTLVDQFMAMLVELRQQRGLPLSLVLVGSTPTHSASSPWKRHLQSSSDIQLTHLSPSRQVWMEDFWRHLQESTPPLPIWNARAQLLRLEEDYFLDHHSCTQLVQDLKHHVVSDFYQSSPGTFVWDAMMGSTLPTNKRTSPKTGVLPTAPPHPRFLAWFATYGSAKRWLNRKAGPSKLQDLEKCYQLQTKTISFWWQWHCRLAGLVLGSLPLESHGAKEWLSIDPPNSASFSPDMLSRDVLHKMTVRLPPKHVLLETLAELAKLTQDAEDAESSESSRKHATNIPNDIESEQSTPTKDFNNDHGFPKVLRGYLERVLDSKARSRNKKSLDTIVSDGADKARMLLWELILLVDELPKDEQSHTQSSKLSWGKLHESIWTMLDDLIELGTHALEEAMDEWKQTNCLIPDENKMRESSHSSQRSGSHLNLRREVIQSLSSPAKEMYELVQDCLSISREEWFREFGGSSMDFMHGIWTLTVLGLIQSKARKLKGGGTGIIYEKVSVVWC